MGDKQLLLLIYWDFIIVVIAILDIKKNKLINMLIRKKYNRKLF